MRAAQKNIQEVIDSRPARSRVLDAAIKLFVQKGYFNTSIQDIVREAGVSIGSIYHYFGDKEGIAKALYVTYIDRMSREMVDINTHYTGLRERSRAVIKLLFQLTEQEREAIAFMLGAKLREFLPDETPVCSAKPFELMRSMVKEGMANGEIRELSLIVAVSALFGGALRMIHHRLEGRIKEPLYRHEKEVWECGWRAVEKSQ